MALRSGREGNEGAQRATRWVLVRRLFLRRSYRTSTAPGLAMATAMRTAEQRVFMRQQQRPPQRNVAQDMSGERGACASPCTHVLLLPAFVHAGTHSRSPIIGSALLTEPRFPRRGYIVSIPLHCARGLWMATTELVQCRKLPRRLPVDNMCAHRCAVINRHVHLIHMWQDTISMALTSASI
jgi:hypothetical protein